jgi:hypothetical protein
MRFELHIEGQVFKHKDYQVLKELAEKMIYPYKIYQVWESMLNVKAKRITQEDYAKAFAFMKHREEQKRIKLQNRLRYERNKRLKYERVINPEVTSILNFKTINQ